MQYIQELVCWLCAPEHQSLIQNSLRMLGVLEAHSTRTPHRCVRVRVKSPSICGPFKGVCHWILEQWDGNKIQSVYCLVSCSPLEVLGFQAGSGDWQNSLLSGHRTEVCVSFVAINQWGSALPSQRLPVFFATWPLYLQCQEWRNSPCWIPSAAHLLTLS